MRNKFEIKGEITYIFLSSPKYGDMKALIDTDDLQIVDEFPNTWHPNRHPNTQSFYVVGNLPKKAGKQKKVKLHRWLMNERDPKAFIDHINHQPLDNRRSNLRLCTVSENGMNRRKINVGLSKFKGVTFHKRHGKYLANIRVNNELVHLGYFLSEHEAARAYNEAALKYYGEYAKLNEICERLQKKEGKAS